MGAAQSRQADMRDGGGVGGVETLAFSLWPAIECLMPPSGAGAGEEWRRCYNVTAAAVAKALPSRPWDVNQDTIFAGSESFMQRCRDLQAVCEAAQQVRAWACMHTVQMGCC